MTKMFTLEPNIFPDVNAQNVIFIVRPKLHLMDIIADYVLKYVILFFMYFLIFSKCILYIITILKTNIIDFKYSRIA